MRPVWVRELSKLRDLAMGLAKGGIFGRTILGLPVLGLGFGLGGGVGLGEVVGLRLGLVEGDVGVPVFVMAEED